MSEPAPAPAPPGSAPRPTVAWPRMVIIALALAAVAFGVYYYIQTTEGEGAVPPVDAVRTMRGFLDGLAKQQKLTEGYADADGDLLADPPKDGKFLDPAGLTFSVVGDDPDKAEQTWKPFLDHLAKTTGKPVTYLKKAPGAAPPPASAPPSPAPTGEDDPLPTPPPDDRLRSPEQQLAAVREGHLHVTAFNTGQVPVAVNSAGFHPLFAPATADGKVSAYEMEILVPADSPVQKPEDLKGKTVALAAMSSNSGGRLPLAVLKEKGLSPGTDYQFAFTGDHRRSIAGVAAKKFDAACVANDILQQEVAAGTVKADQVRSVYKSGNFPPLAFGVPYNLDPKVRAAVEKAFESFAFAGTPVGELYKAQDRTKFARVDYRKDFAIVREVDTKLLSLMGGK